MKKMHLTAVIWPEGGRYVSRCPEIGVASYGRTPAAARKALQQAVELWIANARKLGLRGGSLTDEQTAVSVFGSDHPGASSGRFHRSA